MKPSDAFDGNDPSCCKLLLDDDQRIVPCFAARMNPNLRPALRARIRLRMKTAVRWIVILRATCRAHDQTRHGRERAVVRNVLDDRVPRSAIGAVDERIKISTVGGIQKFAEAVCTGCDVRRNRGAWANLRSAFMNYELRIATRFNG